MSEEVLLEHCEAMLLSSPEELTSRYPSSPGLRLQQLSLRSKVLETLQGSGWIVVVGPCSVHHLEGALHYADRLAEIKDQLPEDWILLMRCCFEKSRSMRGWKGLLHGGEERRSLADGCAQTRFFLREVLQRGLGTAAELISPFALPYFEDLLTYGWIGARTCSSQTHRELASRVPFAVGFKNGIDGDVEPAMKSAYSASHCHSQLVVRADGRLGALVSGGNPCPHVILRGGAEGPNVEQTTLAKVSDFMQERELCPRVLVDCSHGNSGHRPERQALILQKALTLQGSVAGILLESYLQGGKRPDLHYQSDPQVSITDPCLSWEETRVLLLEAAERYAAVSIQRNQS